MGEVNCGLNLKEPGIFDLATFLAIIGAVAAAISAVAAVIPLLRTKLPKPTITPTCTTIIGANTDSGIDDLRTFSPGMRRMGFDR
ncbi:hypothetical protein G7077_05065 [Sphingomonas piscis]|uniref:Uncharacterized protein n=1 Tax=Sphingomonas piscis TaxID=2714943 RepID=A0A6G7YNP8_9SPHN|nr:hypothetical protein [Sphingomonas piscis]QIK78368.1 hypothetical protein G7077_05065 [Sphingomonas piscis]